MAFFKRNFVYPILLSIMLLLVSTPCKALSIDESIKQQLKRHYTTGAAVVVAKDGEIIYEYYYGYGDKASKQKVTENTYFKLASVTKLVTAISVMQLVEQGELDLDTDISEYLGYTVKNPYHRKTPVTLRMLMTHTSALDPHGGYADKNNTLRELISNDQIKKENWYNEVSGSKYRYSNFGAGIMGSLIESVANQNIQDFVDAGVFQPLGITASYSASLLPDTENIATLYNTKGSISDSCSSSLMKEWDNSVNPNEHYRITVGSLWMKPTDLCKIGMLLCNQGTLDGVTLLNDDTVLEMEADQKGKGGITANTPYGLCVYHEKTLIDGKTFYGHQGLIDGILCNLYYDPETHLVFVFCSNGCHNQMDNRVAHITRKVFDIIWKEYGG